MMRKLINKILWSLCKSHIAVIKSTKYSVPKEQQLLMAFTQSGYAYKCVYTNGKFISNEYTNRPAEIINVVLFMEM